MSRKGVFDYLNNQEKKDLAEWTEELKNAQSTKTVKLYSSKIKELLEKIEQRMISSGEEAATVSF
ncbi:MULTISPECIES: hypothetical protein [Bacillus cereus group]|uniref:hypothetical protein n=1 Tax=Bacillus cereus group TaxID=86661 RepID=UPI000871B767|nr:MULTISPECIES: hypothetical protein [Bacillus cereus group]OFD02289.1 hypothetical protein BTGOE7_52780 [Bacillus thuringiensis]MBJ8048080.1 hypothetical protein [Bacillus cereus group sp. N18]PEA64743.1 hypothetical protein COO18_21425 [Bacillus toyonensis]PGA31445.1 hypothetical protein COL81_30280 [Bacillus toyonensis]HDR7380505.1 hypothetical protein [Bacillus toyonensis]